MAAPKIFITGGTGYIGGTVLDTLVKKHPEYEITALLRRVPEKFQQLYPNVKIVRGDYDNVDIIANAAAEADIVVQNGDSDHEPSLQAEISGLLRRHSTPNNNNNRKPSFLIHLSGTGIIADWRDDAHRGRLNPHIWSDVTDLDAIAALRPPALHAHTEKILRDTSAAHGEELKIAIVSPPDIYGPGTGPGGTRSILLAEYAKEVKRHGAAFYVREGGNTRSFVHVEDLMAVYLRLVEAAVGGGRGAEWGREGYYFASTQEVSQLEVARAVGRVLFAKGLIPKEEPEELEVERVGQMGQIRGYELGYYLYASNARTRADRAAKLFGYTAKHPGLWDLLEAELENGS